MRYCSSSVCGWSPPFWLGNWEFLDLWTRIADHIPNLKTETINSKHRTQLQILTYKLQVSKLTCALLVSTSVLMCNAKRLAVASLENGTYVYNSCCVLLGICRFWKRSYVLNMCYVCEDYNSFRQSQWPHSAYTSMQQCLPCTHNAKKQHHIWFLV